MSISEEEIRRFIAGELDEKQGKLVQDYLLSNKENSLFSSAEKDWNSLQSGKLDRAGKEEMYDYIINAIKHHKQKKQRLFKRVIAYRNIAAVLFIAIITIVFLRNRDEIYMNQNNLAVVPKNNWADTVNSSSKNIEIMLKDGSTVFLHPNSRLRYYKDTVAIKNRELYLDGIAFFKVSKDKKHPFIVYTGKVSTMALGTSFCISTLDNNIRVRLKTGKVLLSKEQNNLEGWNKDVILTPGQYLFYDSRQKVTSVKRFTKAENERGVSGILMDQKERVTVAKPHQKLSKEFINAPIADVIKVLQELYNIKIDYNESDLDGIRFSGRINSGDNVEKILKLICNLNDIIMHETPTGYQLKKIK